MAAVMWVSVSDAPSGTPNSSARVRRLGERCGTEPQSESMTDHDAGFVVQDRCLGVPLEVIPRLLVVHLPAT